MKTVLVTGSAGFIGFYLCTRLLKDGFRVIGLDAMTAFMDIELAGKLIDTPYPTHAVMRFDHRSGALQARKVIEKSLGEGHMLWDWDDGTKEIVAVNNIRKSALAILVGVLFILAGLTISNTLIILRPHEMARGSVDYFSWIFQSRHEHVEGISQSSSSVSHAMCQVQPSVFGFYWGRPLSILYFFNRMIHLRIDDLLVGRCSSSGE